MNDDTPISIAAPRRRGLRWRWALPVLLLGLAGAAGAAWWVQRAEAHDPRQRYLLAKVEKGDIEDLVSATGSLQPRDYVDVGAQVSGQLRRIHVDVGSVVREGDLLAEIDAEQSQARVEANRASLRAQQATLADREVTLGRAEREAQRQRQLMADEATTTQALENAETDLRSALTGIAQVKAQIEQTRASMRVEEANLKYTRIYAPMAGTVVSITARQGQTLNANQQAPTLLRIANLETMTVQTQVSEADVSKLRSGMQAYFTTLGSQGRRWWGALRKVEPTPTVTNNVVLYNALFDVPNANQQLMTQMTAQVYFVVAQAQDVLTVPMAALTVQRTPRPRGEARPEGAASAPPTAASAPRRAPREGAAGRPRTAKVKVLADDGTVQEREIRIGLGNRVSAQVLDGLVEGDEVVLGVKGEDPPRRAAAGNSNAQRSGSNLGLGPQGGLPGGPGFGGPGGGR